MGRIVTQYVYARRRRIVTAAMSLAHASLLVWALARFYRPFIYDDAAGRVWGLADDVYISASFARSLFDGHGLVWYPGAPHVEGITNPLWTLFIAGLHGVVGFSEDRLGLFVACLNGALLFVVATLFGSTVVAAARRHGDASSLALVPSTLVLLPLTAPLSYWSAEGFEVALLAGLALALFAWALRPGFTYNGVALGVLFTAGCATRMDFVVVATPAIFLLCMRCRSPRQFGWMCLTAFIGIGLLFVARRVYFGDWLPNTYYLKATGWPLRHRIQRGVDQNAALLAIVPAFGVPVLVAWIRRRLPGSVLPITAAWLGFTASVAYSTYVGGDAWWTFAGYDRHTVVGSLFLSWGLCVFVATLAVAWPIRILALLWSCALGGYALVANGGVTQLTAGLFAAESPVRELERDWIRYGKQFKEISAPGARIAVCPAGAIIYFSHRGGVDMLGKVDPFVAHLPVAEHPSPNMRCWRNAPGHNKEDDVALFGLRKPEFSRYSPPREYRQFYEKYRYQGTTFHVLKGSPFLAPR